MTVDIAELRDYIANFDDFFRPIRNYFYWEPHCYNIPLLVDAVGVRHARRRRHDDRRRSGFAPGPGAARFADAATVGADAAADRDDEDDEEHDADDARHPGRACRISRPRMSENQSAMGDAFNDSWNDDTFYLPPEIFDNEEFKRGMDSFISPNGHAVRMIIQHEGDPLSTDGIDRIEAIKHAAKEAIKGTPLEGSTIYLGGTAVGVQGHAGRQQLRPAHRGHPRAGADLHHHADHHAQSSSRPRSSSAPWCCRWAHRSACRF